LNQRNAPPTSACFDRQEECEMSMVHRKLNKRKKRTSDAKSMNGISSNVHHSRNHHDHDHHQHHLITIMIMIMIIISII
jgi:hypothetical protein